MPKHLTLELNLQLCINELQYNYEAYANTLYGIADYYQDNNYDWSDWAACGFVFLMPVETR